MKQKIVLFIYIFGLSLVGCSSKMEFTKIETPQQAWSGKYKTEDFTQGYTGKKLDILVVVDNSVSMTEEQNKLGDKIDSFLSTLYDVDWQLGITTTDVSDGAFGIKGSLLNFTSLSSYILNPKSHNYQQAFKATVVRSETLGCNQNCPSGDEQPLKAAMMAIDKRNTENAGFFRQGADLALLVLTDEDEMSTGPSNATQPSEVINKVHQIWGDQKRLLTYGMIIQPGDKSCFNQNNGVGNYGNFIESLSALTGGLTGSICDTDYGPTLGIIGDHARQLINAVQLQLYPLDVASMTINFTPAHKTTWTVSGRDIIFANPPPKGTQIKVTYLVE